MNQEAAPVGDSNDHCAGCGAPMAGRYCAECGEGRVQRITFRRVLEDAAHHVLTLDPALVRTVVGLTMRPGKVCREYVGGRRKAYVNPILSIASGVLIVLAMRLVARG